MSSTNERLTKKSIIYLAKFQKQEAKLQRKLQKLNPELELNKADEKYKELSQKLKDKATPINKIVGGEYNGYLDSLGSSLSFLKQCNGISDKVKEPLKSFNQLQDKLQQSEKIRAFIAERKMLLKETLSKYTQLPAGLKNQYDKLSKTAYYYSAQIHQIKETVKDPKKIEQQALAVLKKVPAFQKFMQKNSQLASLFNLPSGNSDPTQALAGLQTRASVQGMIQQRISAGGSTAMAQVQQNLQNAQSQLLELKDQLLKSSGIGSVTGDPGDMPDFKPNTQKSKTLWQRLEYGFNIQFSKNNSLAPSGSDLALMVGYKMNDKTVMDIGASYKLGLGSIQHIRLTSQGVGLRSYLDWKAPFTSKNGILAGLYLAGGYEMNYISAFKNIEQLRNYPLWQRSALLGISKKYQISAKMKGNMQLLYDFLAREHVLGQPLVFRLGYNF